MEPEDAERRIAERSIRYRGQLAAMGTPALLETFELHGLPAISPQLTRLIADLSVPRKRPWWRRILGLR